MCFRPADVGGGDQRDPSAGGGLPLPRGLLITVCGLEPPEDLQELARTPSASPVSFICLSRLLVHNIILQLATTGRTKPLIQRPLGLCSDTWISELSKIICQPFLLLFSEHGQTKSDRVPIISCCDGPSMVLLWLLQGQTKTVLFGLYKPKQYVNKLHNLYC